MPEMHQSRDLSTVLYTLLFVEHRTPVTLAEYHAPFARAAMSGPPGGAIRSYGAAVLGLLPNNSLLLSHTDLTWNPVRCVAVSYNSCRLLVTASRGVTLVLIAVVCLLL